MPLPEVATTSGRSDWLDNFQAWAARPSPATVADLIDVLGRSCEWDIGDQEALGKAAGTAREHLGVRVPQLVTRFWWNPAEPPAASRPRRQARWPLALRRILVTDGGRLSPRP